MQSGEAPEKAQVQHGFRLEFEFEFEFVPDADWRGGRRDAGCGMPASTAVCCV